MDAIEAIEEAASGDIDKRTLIKVIKELESLTFDGICNESSDNYFLN